MSKRQDKNSSISKGKIYAVLSYLSVFCIIPLVFQKENPFVLSHGKQGLVLFVGQVGSFVAHIVLGHWFLKMSVVVVVLYSLVGIIKVISGQYVRLPFVCAIADRITL